MICSHCGSIAIGRRCLGRKSRSIFTIVICVLFTVVMASPSFAQISYYPNGRTLQDSYGIVYYPNGRTVRDSYGNIYYANGRTLRNSYGTIDYPNGRSLKDSYGNVSYPSGRALRDSYRNISYSSGRQARDSYGNTYYENGRETGGPITISVDLGCGFGMFMYQASECSDVGLIMIELGYGRYFCVNIDTGESSVQ